MHPPSADACLDWVVHVIVVLVALARKYALCWGEILRGPYLNFSLEEGSEFVDVGDVTVGGCSVGVGVGRCVGIGVGYWVGCGFSGTSQSKVVGASFTCCIVHVMASCPFGAFWGMSAGGSE